MKTLIVVAAVLLLAAQAEANPYFRPGFNQVAGGAFWPLAGALDTREAGFITPAITHSAADGYFMVKGLSWNPLNVGYVGGTGSFSDFTHGKLALGPSIQGGDSIKAGLRLVCAYLPGWSGSDTYGAVKALLAPGDVGIYADAGVYLGIPLNQFGSPGKIQPRLMVGGTLNKRFAVKAAP